MKPGPRPDITWADVREFHRAMKWPRGERTQRPIVKAFRMNKQTTNTP